MNWSLASVDGVITGAREARVGVLDRGLLFGDTVFETLRTYDGRPLQAREHIGRLVTSAIAVRMTPPEAAVVERSLREIVHSAGGGDLRVKVVWTRGGETFAPALVTDNPSRLIVLVGPLTTVTPSPISLLTLPCAPAAASFAGAKYGRYLPNLLALDEARSRGYDEAIWVDTGGNVLEGATSNVFVVTGKGLITPSVGSAILAGLTRASVLRLAGELGLVVSEGALSLDEFRGAHDVFVTSSVRGIAVVSRIDDRELGAPTVAEDIRRAYEDWAKSTAY